MSVKIPDNHINNDREFGRLFAAAIDEISSNPNICSGIMKLGETVKAGEDGAPEITPMMVRAGIDTIGPFDLMHAYEGSTSDRARVGHDYFSGDGSSAWVALGDQRAVMPEGTQVVLISMDNKFTSGHLLLPDGSRVELHPEAWGNQK